jgi:type III restriction enzyme
MKLHFEPDLDYQLQAIEAVCDLFRGQEVCRSEFTVTFARTQSEAGLGIGDRQLGIGNDLTLLDDEILENLRAVQLRNGVPPSEKLASGDFTVEMETGTGKTYVYLRTIFELNKRYGFTKFVIVVPSVAIKEGVYKSLQMTEEHFRGLYAAVPFEYFTYDSGKLGQVRNFATSSHIQIMVVTVGAINKKDINNLYKDSEKTGGEKPIDLIKATRPVIIVDEPQSVDGGLQGRGREALGLMRPLCTLRYSATHVDKHNMVYRLDAVDAYEKKLVKQIEVAAATVVDAFNKPYVRVVSVSNRRAGISARVEVDVLEQGGVRRREVTVQDGDDLQLTTRRPVYADCRIGEIRSERGNQFVELRVPGANPFLRIGEAWGDVDRLAVQREMIRRTIREHLEKERRLRPQGIKVLSLFFVDAVEKYRKYDEEGNPVKGDFALIFEEEYRRLAKHPDFASLFTEVDLSRTAEEVHGGYFSIDRRKVGSKTLEFYKDTGGETQADDDTYSLIMRDKEKLLALETPLKFIFSHSALREGWDNPNVFQICTLRDIRTERERRQTIGRGLRLCVNQAGDRVRGFDVNTLTVTASESYEEFAENLQREIEADTGIRFGVVEPHQFAAIAVTADDGTQTPLGFDASRAVWEHLHTKGYIDGSGKVQDSLRLALKEGTLQLPEGVAGLSAQITAILRKLAGRLDIKNAEDGRTVKPRRAVLDSKEFRELWDRIKHKTTYRVAFDNERLIQDCIRAIVEAPPVPRTRLHWRTANLMIGEAGVQALATANDRVVVLDERDIDLPDLLTELQDRTQLTRRSIHRVLITCGRLREFTANPQGFIDVVAEAINRQKQLALVDGIKYQRLGDEYYYAQELFETQELSGYLKANLRDAAKSVYEQVVYESDTEAAFADELERNSSIKVYAKLPRWFTVPTPLGAYVPDWAVLVQTDEGERVYLVVETKAGLYLDDLRDREKAKIACGKEHFKALEAGAEPARYKLARNLDDVLQDL